MSDSSNDLVPVHGGLADPVDRVVPLKERKAFLLRLPPALMAELKRWAAQDLRSVNGQIEFLLRDAVRRRKGEEE